MKKAEWMKRIPTLGDTAREVRDRIEATLREATGIEDGFVFADLPEEVVRVSEERFTELGIRFLMGDGAVVSFRDIDPAFSDYVSRAKPTRSLFSVYCEEERADEVEAATVNLLRSL